MRRSTLNKLLMVLCLASGSVSAETIYVDDYLRLGVRPNPNSSERPVAVVTTGDALQVLERSEGYIKVRSGDVEGWVSDSYVSSEKPARTQLAELREAHEKLGNELEKSSQQQAEAEQQAQSLEQQVASQATRIATLEEELSEYRSHDDEQRQLTIWLIQLAVVVALFLLGLFLGVRWQRRRVSDRLGGLEI